MASLFKQDDHYYLQFYDATRSPKRKRIALGVRDKRTAERLRIEHESAYVRGELDPWAEPLPEPACERDPRNMLSDGITLLLREKEAEGKSPTRCARTAPC